MLDEFPFFTQLAVSPLMSCGIQPDHLLRLIRYSLSLDLQAKNENRQRLTLAVCAWWATAQAGETSILARVSSAMSCLAFSTQRWGGRVPWLFLEITKARLSNSVSPSARLAIILSTANVFLLNWYSGIVVLSV